MTDRPGKKVVIAAALAAVVAIGWARTTAAKPRKSTLTATIDGKRFKFRGRYVLSTYGGVGTITLATKPARPGSILRVVGFGCAIYPPNEAFPLMPPPAVCSGSYTETKVSRNPVSKAWLAVQGVQVTYQSFDGSRIAGTFSGVLDPLSGTTAAAPVTIEGAFDTSITGE